MTSPPTKLGPYEIIREIARSNDIVYEAYDGVMNRRVAVKELAIPAGSTGPQAEDRIARFRREAQAVGSLNHPHIMTVYSFAEDAGRWYIAMEFLDGTTLRKIVDDRGTMPVEEAVKIVGETLDGLGHAHANGVVHRDIKPDNIQIVSNGGVKITDFGIARLTHQPNLTVDGQVFGTPSYMSPEQIVGRDIDARSDLFSVGAMLYEMIAGVKPFPGDNVVAITYNIVNTPAPRSPLIPDAVWGVIERSLDKSSSQRFGSAAEMRDALRDSLRAGIAPPPVSSAPSMASAQTPWGVAPPLAPPVIGGYGPGGYGTVPPMLGGPGYPGSTQQIPNPLAGVPDPYAMPASYSNAPIYYPPPPKQPILSPEASRAMGRFLGIFVTIALVFGILFTVLQMIIGFATDQNAGQTGSRPGKSPAVRAAPGRAAPGRTGEVAAAVPEVEPSPSGAAVSAKLEDLRADCRNGDAPACETLVARAGQLGEGASGTRLADAQSLYAEACAGLGRRPEAVASFVLAATTRAGVGATRGEIREDLFAAENEAVGDATLEAMVADAERRLLGSP